MRRNLILLFVLLTCTCFTPGDQMTQSVNQKDYSIQPVPFTSVKIQDKFWTPRQETSRKTTIPYCFEKCEETGRISNFAKAGGLMEGDFKGIFFNDSDLYKVIEGAAYSLQNYPDSVLEKYVDQIIDQIATAQWEDGYLYTYYSLPQRQPEKRWTNIRVHHELYCVGHFYEAAVAYYQATGKRKILDIALKNADLIDQVFGPNKKHAAPGHQEIEMGLVRLYRLTGEKRYLNLAKFFLDQRGNQAEREIFGDYCQDHLPVTEQHAAVGHAVRAGYMYSGMADVAALTGNKSYINAIEKIWEDVVSRKYYITGGIGASRHGEAFGEAYVLPNLTAYNETCAAIANVFWNHRMFLLNGHAKYLDVLEKTLYNGLLSGISLDGKHFFYPNPLECDAEFQFNQRDLTRKSWFNCSCCPVNVARIIPSLSGYIYAQQNEQIFVNLFIGSTAQINIKNQTVKINQQTDYPWNGQVNLEVEPEKALDFSILIRIPGWAREKPVPSNLYHFAKAQNATITIKVNGQPVKWKEKNGFVVIQRLWKRGDTIQVDLPMPVRRVIANKKVIEDSGRVAIQRGPIVYCAEGVDNSNYVRNLALPENTELSSEHQSDLLGGITLLKGKGIAKEIGSPNTITPEIKLIPYYAWSHRGIGEMAVWLPQEISMTKRTPVPVPTVVPGDKIVELPAEIKITINKNLPDSKLYFTLDGSEPTENSAQYQKPIPITKNSTLRVRAFKPGYEPSKTVTSNIYFVKPGVNGLKYDYYEGKWKKLPDFSSLKVLKSGKTYSFKLKSLEPRVDHWGVIFQSYLKIPTQGNYTFYTKSDDGTKLFINDKLVVDNDGSHGILTKTGSITLKPGMVKFKLLYYEDDWGEFLEVGYEGPGIKKQVIPASEFFLEK